MCFRWFVIFQQFCSSLSIGQVLRAMSAASNDQPAEQSTLTRAQLKRFLGNRKWKIVKDTWDEQDAAEVAAADAEPHGLSWRAKKPKLEEKKKARAADADAEPHGQPRAKKQEAAAKAASAKEKKKAATAAAAAQKNRATKPKAKATTQAKAKPTAVARKAGVNSEPADGLFLLR